MKAVVSPTLHSRVVSGVTVVSRVSAFIAWFPESDEASGEAAATRTDSNLLAVRFADNRAPGAQWEIDTRLIDLIDR